MTKEQSEELRLRYLENQGMIAKTNTPRIAYTVYPKRREGFNQVFKNIHKKLK